MCGVWCVVCVCVCVCVCKIKREGKVLSPIGIGICVTVCVSLNEFTAQMTDTVELVRVGTA